MNVDEDTLGRHTVYWLERAEADVPQNDEWLSVPERLRLREFKIDKRRRDWRLGRWTAKCAVSGLMHQLRQEVRPLCTIEVQVLSTGAPSIESLQTELTISLSHRDGLAMCALVPADLMLGCDIELIEPRSDAFIADYFTIREQQAVERAGSAEGASIMTTLLWSAKESTLKALQVGLRADTRMVEVNLTSRTGNLTSSGANWSPLLVTTVRSEILCGWWMRRASWIRTIVGVKPSRPRSLENHKYHISCRDRRGPNVPSEHY